MGHKRPTEKVSLSRKEAQRVANVALLTGGDPDAVSSALVSAAFERRMRKKTGKAPAKVYAMKRK